MSEEGYRGPQVCKIVGITYRQLDYWARTDLLKGGQGVLNMVLPLGGVQDELDAAIHELQKKEPVADAPPAATSSDAAAGGGG